MVAKTRELCLELARRSCEEISGEKIAPAIFESVLRNGEHFGARLPSLHIRTLFWRLDFRPATERAALYPS